METVLEKVDEQTNEAILKETEQRKRNDQAMTKKKRERRKKTPHQITEW